MLGEGGGGGGGVGEDVTLTRNERVVTLKPDSSSDLPSSLTEGAPTGL